MLYVLLSKPDSYRDVTKYLESAGARVLLVGSDKPGAAIPGKLAILKGMLSPAVLRARNSWTASDRVLVVGWQALPILVMLRLGLLPRPAKLAIVGCFIHGRRARQIINRAWRMLRFPGLAFITFSPGETRNLLDEVGMPADRVHFHLWRQDLDGQADAASIGDDGYIFSGGFSNRDYDLLLNASKGLPAPVVVVAAGHNTIDAELNPQATIHRNLPEAEFEQLLARSKVVALPLRSQGEACGQSVLLRVLRNGKPLIATRHEAIEAYLGSDYQGFVAPDDVAAMRDSLARALADDAFRAQLSAQIARASRDLDGQHQPGREIEQFLLA